MRVLLYIIIALLYFYTAYAAFVGNVYGKKTVIIDAILIFLLSIVTFCAESNIEYLICFIGDVVLFLFEVVDVFIYHSLGVSKCIHLKKTAYSLVSLVCLFVTILFVVQRFWVIF